MSEHKTPVVQRRWFGALVVAFGFLIGSIVGAVFFALLWGGSFVFVPNGEFRSPAWRIALRTLTLCVAIVLLAVGTRLWSGADAADQEMEEPLLFADVATARFETGTGLGGECRQAASLATLDHSHASAFDAMLEADGYLDQYRWYEPGNESRFESGFQLVPFGQGGGVLERIAIVAEQTNADGTLILVITAELFPAVTEGTAGARRARLAFEGDSTAGAGPPATAESVVTMHVAGPCPSGLGFDFWVNATRADQSSRWDMDLRPLWISSGPYGG